MEPVVGEFQRRFGQIRVDLRQTEDWQFVEAFLDTMPNRLGTHFRKALYEQTRGHALFTVENPNKVEEGEDWLDNINPESLVVKQGCKMEPSLASAEPGERFQFERKGYFCVDPATTADRPVFNRTVTLRDTWAKLQKRL